MQRRTLLRSAIIAAACFAVTPIRAIATDDIVARFQQRYQGLKSVRCTFNGSANQRGTLAAIRGGKFRLTTGDRVIVSDGSSVYNATPSTKTVIVNRFNPKATDVSIERVFFDVLTIYRASVQSSKGGSTTLRLVPPASTAVVYGVRELLVVISTSSLAITSITATTDAGQFTFAISQLKINTAVPASTFTYAAPQGWEVIDLR